jgi:hypothetical protein
MELKRPGSETYHLHPASAKVKNGGAVLLFPHA